MDIRRICEELSDRWPEWGERISLLQFLEADGLGAAANDGRSVIYNDRLMSYYTQEHQCFYVAQQIMHLQLNHFARGKGRDPILWKRASDAVVNALLKADGFDLPEDAVYLADAAEQSAEEIYEVLLEDAEEKNENEPLVVREVVLPQSESKQAGKETDAQTRTIDDPGLAAVVAGLAELLEPSMQMDFDWFPGMTIRDGVLGHEFRPYPVAHAEILQIADLLCGRREGAGLGCYPLSQHGKTAHMETVNDLIALIRPCIRDERKLVALTFDDGPHCFPLFC